jgi:cofilin
MMSSGITVHDDCISEFTALRMKRTHRYLIYKVSDDKTQIVIDQVGARDSTFAEFKELMPKDQCR